MAVKKETISADLLKLVSREVQKHDKDGKPLTDKEGKPVTEKVAIKAEDVHAFKVYEDCVVVVTTDGKKFRGEKK